MMNSLMTALGILSVPIPAFGENKTITHNLSRTFGSDQPRHEAELVAVALAEHEILDKAIAHLKEIPIIHLQNLTGTEIRGLALILCKPNISSADISRNPDDEFEVSVSASVDVDTETLEEKVTALLRYRVNLEGYGKIHQRRREILSDMGRQALPEVAKKLRSVESRRKGVDTLMNAQDYEKALEHLDQSVSLDPDHAEAYNTRAFIHMKLNQFDHALEDLDRSIRIKPKLYKAYNNRGTIYGIRGEGQKAVEDYDHAIRLNPEYASAYINRGMERSKAGESQNAYEDFRKACELGNCVGLEVAFSQGFVKPEEVIDDLISRAAALQWEEKNRSASLNLWEIVDALMNSVNPIVRLNLNICKYHLGRMKEVHREASELLLLFSSEPHSPINDVLLALALLTAYGLGDMDATKETAMKIGEIYDNPWDLPGIPVVIGGSGEVVEESSVAEIISALSAAKEKHACTKPEKKLLESLIAHYMVREKKVEGRDGCPKPN